MFKQGDKVEVKKPDLHVEDEMLSQQAVFTLKATSFKGEVTQVQDGLNYVAFKHGDVWLTQVFKDDELKAVK